MELKVVNHPFSTYAKFSENVTFQGVRNVVFWGKFCVHTKWIVPMYFYKNEMLDKVLNTALVELIKFCVYSED